MDATKQNYRIAEQIIETLVNENCTIDQATEILAFVSRQIRCTSHVQFSAEALVERTDAVN